MESRHAKAGRDGPVYGQHGSRCMYVLSIRCIAFLLSRLPLKLNQALGAALGHIAWITNSRSRQITEINLELCQSSLDDQERQRLAKASLIETGKQLTECPWLWLRPIDHTLNRITEFNGEHLLTEAIEKKTGLIAVSPHIGNWEICNACINKIEPLTYMYRRPRNPALDALLIDWRGRVGGRPAVLESGGIRKALRILKSGGVVGILPDQEPDLAHGVFAPFFGVPALTMTLLSKLAQRSKARIVFCVAERLPSGNGWRMHYFPGDDDIASSDIELSTTAVNRGVERCVQICPAQYLWDYKRFATQPDGSRRNYRKS